MLQQGLGLGLQKAAENQSLFPLLLCSTVVRRGDESSYNQELYGILPSQN
jgi:hypothetical protein